VTITGTGFSTTVANDKLYFNGKAAVVQYATVPNWIPAFL
jgi:hypothetical protein